MAQSQRLVEQATRHQVLVERLKSGEVNQFAKFLKDIDESIRKRLAGKELTEYSRKRLERLLVSVEKDLSSIYQDHYDELSGSLLDIAEYEAEFEAKSLGKAVTNFEPVIPASVQVAAAVFSSPLSVRGVDGGKLLEPFIKDWSNNEVKRVSGAIRQGFFEGQTTNQILQKVRGTRANKYRDGILAISNRNASSIVRTAVQHTASVARQQTWQENDDVVVGYQWLSTLDSKTSAQCRSLDGKVFKQGKGPLPPIHINCRSTTIPEIDGRYNLFKGEGERASIDGPVPANQTYYEWLKKQPAAFQDEAIGVTRARLLRDGGLTAERFAELNLGRNFKPLNLAEMRKLEPLAFEKMSQQVPLKKQAEKVKLANSIDKDVLVSWMGSHNYTQLAGELQNPRIKKLAKEYKLTQAEQVALRHYTGTGYDDINRHLWGLSTSKSEALSKSSDVLRRALDKLPNYEGITFRRTDLPAAVLAQHEKGSFVSYKAFTSTSYEKELDGFGQHRLIIQGRTGKRLGWISHFNEKEREVLFTSPTDFYVENRFTDKDGIITVNLIETKKVN